MPSYDPADNGEKVRRLSEEEKDIVGSNGNLLADNMDRKTKEVTKSPTLTISDVVDSTGEGFVETDQIRKLEKTHSRKNSKRRESWLLPSIPDVFLENLENIENDPDENLEADDRLPSQQGTLSELTMRLSAHNVKTNVIQEIKLETVGIQNPEHHSEVFDFFTGTDHLECKTRKIPRQPWNIIKRTR